MEPTYTVPYFEDWVDESRTIVKPVEVNIITEDGEITVSELNDELFVEYGS